jgi:hypothetical protein
MQAPVGQLAETGEVSAVKITEVGEQLPAVQITKAG